MIRPLLLCISTGLLAALPLRAAPDSFAYVLQADSFATDKAAAIRQLETSGRDWIVLDSRFDNETAWEPADLGEIRAGKKGRKVIAYISIGEAEDYRSYWDEKWNHGAKPAWLLGENPHWKGNFRVAYWHPEWQAIMLKVVDGAMAAGFDGVYLDIVDGFEAFEKDGTRFIDDRPNPATRQSYRRDMVDWVKRVAAQARAKNPAALVVPQNGSQLLAHPDFVATISGVGIEDLFTEDDRKQPASHSDYVLGFLKVLQETGKPVLVIEYPEREKSMTFARESNQRARFTWLITDRDLKTLGTSGR
ncbi:endo alpha-1,4 polygalactosaminidase [Luteolibacter sp. SL250]|uniref:MJ1477/TM1410 family putative glycoside hydrolase n=1 Tax=Luteolibacter sp. SL250 TaxID=2995170 RepID=UPI002271C189|nr:MJ1477/TM1410 family putative glycoside hydrolase [Luteolibacter sp. SL250]WAC19599.1 endo alpha-1,4 polygalactosaminidase [Luteolibacter sp. SL250]